MTVQYRDITTGQDRPEPALPPSEQSHPSLYRDVGKRCLDVALVLLAAPVVVTIVAILALLIARDGHTPFYSQTRIGRGGKLYRIWKLRSMVVDADARIEGYLAANPAARLEWDRTQKLRDDPRVTPFGHFLRRSSLDELPQLWNVLVGEMSLVGPRPMMPCQAALYPGTAYYDLRPGITGLWQVSARNRSRFIDRARFDTQYNNRLSLLTDIKLLLATPRVVTSCTGY